MNKAGEIVSKRLNYFFKNRKNFSMYSLIGCLVDFMNTNVVIGSSEKLSANVSTPTFCTGVLSIYSYKYTPDRPVVTES